MFETNERILPTESKQIASTLKNELTQRGVTFHEDVQLDENSIQKTMMVLQFILEIIKSM